MNFGIIGTGMIGGFHAKAIAAMNGGRLIGAANRTREGAQAFAEQYSTLAYDSVEAMLADPQIDIVTIGTPSGAHLDPAMAAIAAGKHVIIEKPLEVTTERIDLMVAAAKAKGVTLAAVLNRRFHQLLPASAQLRRSGQRHPGRPRAQHRCQRSAQERRADSSHLPIRSKQRRQNRIPVRYLDNHFFIRSVQL